MSSNKAKDFEPLSNSNESTNAAHLEMSPLSPTHSRTENEGLLRFPSENPFANYSSSNHNLHHQHTLYHQYHQFHAGINVDVNVEGEAEEGGGGNKDDANNSRYDSDSSSDAPPTNLLVEETRPLVEDRSNAHEEGVSRTLKSLKSALVKNLNLPPRPTPRPNPTLFYQSPPISSRSPAADTRSSWRSVSEPRRNNRFQSDDEESAVAAAAPLYSNDADDDVDYDLMDDATRALRIWNKIDDLDDFLLRVRVANWERSGDTTELPGIQTFFLIIFGIWWLYQLIRMIIDIPHLYEIKLVYNHLLEIQESDMDTVEWQEIVQKLSQLRYTRPDLTSSLPQQITGRPSSQQHQRGLENLNAHTIVNRIMRKDNYVIAMFNKDILNLRVPGTLGAWMFGNKRQLVTRVIEWNLYFCVLLYAFDEKGGLRKRFLKNNYRRRLVVGLQKRFELMAFLNLLFSPFLLAITVLYFIFKYAE
ncbi:UNVERIFIED_CONTAM: autophagy protein atg9, partial [Siphonaria sp. JEL0065]